MTGVVEEPLDLGEGDDLVHPPVDLVPAHPQDRAVQVDVLPTGQLGVEARAHLEQRPHPAVDDALGPRSAR